MLVAVAACGGSGDGGEDPADDGARACEAAHGCGLLSDADLTTCKTTAASINAPRALTECADCLEQRACAQVASGACGASCAQFRDALEPPGPSGVSSRVLLRDLTNEQAQTICTWYFEQSGGEDFTVSCGPYNATTGSYSSCVSSLVNVTASCTATVATFEDCTLSVGEQLCKRLDEPSCQMVASC